MDARRDKPNRRERGHEGVSHASAGVVGENEAGEQIRRLLFGNSNIAPDMRLERLSLVQVSDTDDIEHLLSSIYDRLDKT